MHNKRYIIIILLLIIIILIPILFFAYKKLSTRIVAVSGLLCPDDYKTAEEATTAMNAWTNNFFDTHPNASMTDWGNARYQFYIDNHCTDAIQRYKQAQAGNADTATMNRINQGINSSLGQ